jgi:hypothetical protein
MRTEQFFLHPPGAIDAGRSGWRQQQDDTRLAGIGIESRLQILHSPQIGEGCSLTAAAGGRGAPGDQEEEQEQCPLGVASQHRLCHDMCGFRLLGGTPS